MKRPNITPGPWAIGSTGVLGESSFIQPGTPCTQLGYCWNLGGQGQANALAIAAIPALLEYIDRQYQVAQAILDALPPATSEIVRHNWQAKVDAAKAALTAAGYEF